MEPLFTPGLTQTSGRVVTGLNLGFLDNESATFPKPQGTPHHNFGTFTFSWSNKAMLSEKEGAKSSGYGYGIGRQVSLFLTFSLPLPQYVCSGKS